jgi:hypothetical protein
MRSRAVRVATVIVIVLGVSVAGACEIVENPRQPVGERPAPAPAASLLNRAWQSEDAVPAPGTLRVFLEDGTLLMTSCGEVYRLARWEVTEDGRLSWLEDGARVEAGILQQTPDTLVLELELGTERVEQRFTNSAAPFVCPSLPR